MRQVTEALQIVSPSLRTLAEEVGVSYPAMRSYRSGARNPSVQVLKAIERAIRSRAYALSDHANALANLIMRRTHG